jgi:transcription elongation factor Elf1
MAEELSFRCPHCQHPYTDGMELLDADEAHVFCCENCAKTFSVLLKECSVCAANTPIVQMELWPSASVFQLYCSACGEPLS